MAKALDNTGLTALVRKIKQALFGKQPRKLEVAITNNGSTITADKTYQEIVAAYNAGADIVLSESGYLYTLICAEDGYFEFENVPYDEYWTRYRYSLESDGTWSFYDINLQERLVSGTNIKTINNGSVLGGGNLTLTPKVEYASTAAMEADNTQPSGAIGYNQEEETWNIYDQPSGEWRRIDGGGLNEIASITTSESSVSGGNNSVTITETNGTSHTFNVKNGKDGADGVSLGEIALVQTTGDSEESVMSQNAVTEYGRKVTAEDLNGTSTWIRSKLEKEGWALGKRLVYNSLYDAPTKCVTPFIYYTFRQGEKITFYYAHEAEVNTTMTILYSEDETQRQNQYENPAYKMELTVESADKIKFKFTLDIEKIPECYVYNETREEFIWKGEDYLAEIVSQYDSNLTYEAYNNSILSQNYGDSAIKTMSQKAITNAFEADIYINRPTYLKGRLTYFSLEDYPEFDPRTADGISVLFIMNNNNVDRIPLFDLWNPLNSGNNGFAGSFFGVWTGNSLSFGRLKAYGSTDTGGYSYTMCNGHIVLTYNFKTGESKCYKNGALDSTKTTENWNEQTIIRDYFNTCTHINLCAPNVTVNKKTIGVAIFGSVLTEDDVKSIYGAGNSSIKNVVIPEDWKANYLHPLVPTDWGVVCANTYGTVTATTDGYIVTPLTNKNDVYFGFNGITENVRNNLIYEWDFEITSGSSTHDSTNSWSRKMRVGGGYVNCFTIYDSSGNDVTFGTLSTGAYHVTSKPNNIQVNSVNAGSVWLHYYFICSSDFSMTITNLKVTERGAALECSVNNYRGLYWLQNNGIKLPFHKTAMYGTTDFMLGTDVYIEDTVIYARNTHPQFNGQMAVDTTNGKVYVGYLTTTGGTWKQINNS